MRGNNGRLRDDVHLLQQRAKTGGLRPIVSGQEAPEMRVVRLMLKLEHGYKNNLRISTRHLSGLECFMDLKAEGERHSKTQGRSWRNS